MQPLGLVVTHNVGQVISKEHIILSQLPTETKAVDTPFVAAGNKALNVQTCINAGRLKKIYGLISAIDILKCSLS